MPTHDPAAGPRPDASPRTGTVYGAGGAPLTPRSAPVHRWLMPASFTVGGLGVLVGLLFATGLTPFGPDDVAAPSRAQAPAGPGQPSGAAAGATSPPPSETPSPTPTAAPGALRGALRSVASALCLQPASDRDPQGAPVRQVPCSGAPNQQWRADRSEGDRFTIVNVDSDRCLDVNDKSRKDEATVQQWRCHGRANQQWRIVPTGASFALVSANSDKCLDVPGARTEADLTIQQFSCNGSTAQQWTWVP